MKWWLLFLLLACTQTQTQDLTLQHYESHLHTLSVILAEQQQFADNIALNYDNSTLHKKQVDEYLEWSKVTRPQLQEIKTFIEQNYVDLLDNGKDPIVIRDLIKLMLESEERNEAFFERCNSIWRHYNT